MLAAKASLEAAGLNPDPAIQRLTGLAFANASPLDLRAQMGARTTWSPNGVANLNLISEGQVPPITSGENPILADDGAGDGDVLHHQAIGRGNLPLIATHAGEARARRL